MSVHYSVQRAHPFEAEGELIRLWTSNLGVADVAHAKFAWTYRAAPHPPTNVFLLASGDGGPIVGTAGVGTRRFQIDGDVVLAALLGDFAVDSAHRTLMPAMTLMRFVRTDALAQRAFAYGFPNGKALGVCRRAGFRDLGPLRRYVVVLRHERFVRKVVDIPILTTLASRVVDVALRVHDFPAQLAASRKYEIVWLDDVDARFDRLWESCRRDYAVVSERNAELIRWRLLRHPVERCKIVALVPRGRSDEVTAYAAVLMNDDGTASLRDFFGHKRALSPLLDLLLPAIWRRGASTISIRYLGSDDIVDLLRKHGFEAREVSRTVICDIGSSPDAQASRLADSRNWHLTDADEDA